MTTDNDQFRAGSNLTPDLQIQAGSKKVRGLNKSTLLLIEAMQKIAEETRPITGRGIGYKLFTPGLIKDMSKESMNKVYYTLKIARERGDIPWPWIIDETREPESVPSWDDTQELADGFFYRRNLWQTQPHKVEVWCEKGTIRGVIWPVLAKYGVTLQVMHGFTSATCAWNISNNGNDDRPLIALYFGDYDPSGMNMSESDIPSRLKEYGGDHVVLKRIALTAEQTGSLRSFSADTKKGDPRYKWFKKNYGDQCWELDAMDPRDLRNLVEAEIKSLIDPVLWAQQEAMQERDTRAIDLHMKFLAQQDERKKQAAEIQLRHLRLFQSLNPKLAA
jgi:hypothetical protein